MSELRVASRYAKSLLDLAKSQSQLDAVRDDILYVQAVCNNSKEFVASLKSPIISHDKKMSIFRAIFGNKVGNLTFSFLEILYRKKRENILLAIADEFINQYNHLFNIEKAVVYTATPLTSDLYQDFAHVIQKNTGKNVQIELKVDSSIIGGYILRIGDQQIDESIKTMLQKLKTKFKDNPYVPKI